MGFTTAIAPAEALIDLYRRVPLTALEDFSDNQLSTITSQSQADYNTFSSILTFDSTASGAADTRINLIATVNARRDTLFDVLMQFIAYGVARSTDKGLMETQARSTIQSIKDGGEKLTKELKQVKEDADNALKEIRAVAAEQGVSQKAVHFKDEADRQEVLASKWLKLTYVFSAAVGTFAVLSLSLHKIPLVRPESNFDAVQLLSSKFLIFAVLGYLLILAARNYATHKHNSVVNRHRQNALLTYKTLVEASGSGAQDIVLAHAASCIFSPQDTGFSSSTKDSSSGSKSVLELMTKSTTKE